MLLQISNLLMDVCTIILYKINAKQFPTLQNGVVLTNILIFVVKINTNTPQKLFHCNMAARHNGH